MIKARRTNLRARPRDALCGREALDWSEMALKREPAGQVENKEIFSAPFAVKGPETRPLSTYAGVGRHRSGTPPLHGATIWDNLRRKDIAGVLIGADCDANLISFPIHFQQPGRNFTGSRFRAGPH